MDIRERAQEMGNRQGWPEAGQSSSTGAPWLPTRLAMQGSELGGVQAGQFLSWLNPTPAQVTMGARF